MIATPSSQPSPRRAPVRPTTRHNCKRLPFLFLLFLLGASLPLQAQGAYPTYPNWWTAQGVISSGSLNDFGAANIGQAKFLAVAAINEIDTDLSQFGGAGPTLDAFAAQLLSNEANIVPGLNDYAAVNIGQLKNLAKPIFDRLIAIGYYGPPLGSGTTTSGTYPWLASGHGSPNDYAAANIGQLKYLFSFDPDHSGTGDSIPDWWKVLHSLGPTVTGTSYVPWSAGQVTYQQAYQYNFNPVNYYANIQGETLTVIGGAGQTGTAGGFVSLPIQVAVSDSSGSPLVAAPVIFSVPPDGSAVSVSGTATPVSSVTLVTDAAGYAQVYYRLPPSSSSTTSSVIAASGTAYHSVPEYTDTNPGSYYPPPFGPAGQPLPPIPTQNYAEIDLSGTVTSNQIAAVALDDNNNAAFTFTKNTQLYGEDGNPQVSQFGEFDTYIWQNGTLGQPIITSGTEETGMNGTTAGWIFRDSSPLILTASGSLFGRENYELGTVDSSSGEIESIGYDGLAGLFSADNQGHATDILTLNSVYSSFTDTLEIRGASNKGTIVGTGSGFITGTNAGDGNHEFGFVLSGGTCTAFDTGSYDGVSIPQNLTVINSGFTPSGVSDKGWVIGSGTNHDAMIWEGSGNPQDLQSGVSGTTQAIAINDAGTVLETHIEQNGTTANIWDQSNGIRSISSLIPTDFTQEIWNITPMLLSGTDANGNTQVLFQANYDIEGSGSTGQGIFVLTVATGTNPNSVAQALLPDGESPSDVKCMNAHGVLTLVDPNTLSNGGSTSLGGGSPTPSPSPGAKILPTVTFTGTDANPLVDTGTVSGTASGFDGYTNPHWLMVPENSSNACKALSPASATFTVQFTGTSTDPNTHITVSPQTTNTSPQTLTVSSGLATGSAGQVSVGVSGKVGVGGALQVDVKQHRVLTIEIHEILEQNGTNPLILVPNMPSANDLQKYLNDIYERQTNTHFSVTRHDWGMNYSPAGVVIITNQNNGGAQVANIRKLAKNPNVDFNLYYVNFLTDGGDSTGYSFRKLQDSVIGGNSGGGTPIVSAHELGHLLGLLHPDDKISGYQFDPKATPYNLMHHVVFGTFLDHLQWDVVNSYISP